MTSTSTVTLHQPWATLIALGVKAIETRSWPAPASAVGERLLIHAAAKPPYEGQAVGEWEATYRPTVYLPDRTPLPGRWIIGADGIDPPDVPRTEPLPLGAIVASCTLAACVPMIGDGGGGLSEPGPYLLVCREGIGDRWDGRLCLVNIDEHEWTDVSDQRPYGDFAPGRWAWLLEDVRPTTERCPACWGAGFFYVDAAEAERRGDPGLVGESCGYCEAEDGCPPVPAKGAQRIWRWEP